MAKITLNQYMRQTYPSPAESAHAPGPFLTISRQYGCYGFTLAQRIAGLLNEDAPPEGVWKVYHKDILHKLARETNLAEEILDRQRRSEPNYIADFFQSLSNAPPPPPGWVIQRRITTILRGLAIDGHAVLVGQGGACATRDLPNGLSVRVEAPREWRIGEIASRYNLDRDAAEAQLDFNDREREYLRSVYEKHFPRTPPFDLTFDCSVFPMEEIAQLVVCALRVHRLA